MFAAGIVFVRVADRRFLGRNAGLDILLGIVLGSVLSRGVNGQAAFFPTLGASAVLVFLHHLLSTAAAHSEWVSRWVKGRATVLIKDGVIQHAALMATKVTPDDLEENLRLNGGLRDPAAVAEARLERDGRISVVAKTEK